MLLDFIFHNLHYKNDINLCFLLSTKLCSIPEYTFRNYPLPCFIPQGILRADGNPCPPTQKPVYEEKLMEDA